MAENAAGLPTASGMARFPAVTNRSTAAVVAFLMSCRVDLGTDPSCCQPPSLRFPGGCRRDMGGLPEQGGQGCFPSLRAALFFPTNGGQCGQCQCLLGTAWGWRDACLLSCSPTTLLCLCSAHGKRKVYLMSQGWFRGGVGEGKAC